MGVRFSNSLTRNVLCQALFKKQKNVYSWTYVKHKFFTEAQERNSFDNKDFNETLFLRGISDSILGDKDMQSKKSVAVINFGLHLVKSLSLKKVICLFEKFLKTLQHIKRTLRSNNPIIIWKTTTASLAHMRRSNLRFITRKVCLFQSYKDIFTSCFNLVTLRSFSEFEFHPYFSVLRQHFENYFQYYITISVQYGISLDTGSKLSIERI